MGMSRYYIARQDEFKHVLPTDEEIAKYGKTEKPVNHLGMDMDGMMDKAGRCAQEVEKRFPNASREQKRKLAVKMMDRQ